jgi:hypothetical protein
MTNKWGLTWKYQDILHKANKKYQLRSLKTPKSAIINTLMKNRRYAKLQYKTEIKVRMNYTRLLPNASEPEAS